MSFLFLISIQEKLKSERERVEVLEIENRRLSREADENEDRMRKLQHKVEETQLQREEGMKAHESALTKLKDEMETEANKKVY